MHLTESLIQELSPSSPRVSAVRRLEALPAPRRLPVSRWLKLEFLQYRIGSSARRLSGCRRSTMPSGIWNLHVFGGNHGRGIAYAAREMGVHAPSDVPSSVDEPKVSWG